MEVDRGQLDERGGEASQLQVEPVGEEPDGRDDQVERGCCPGHVAEPEAGQPPPPDGEERAAEGGDQPWRDERGGYGPLVDDVGGHGRETGHGGHGRDTSAAGGMQRDRAGHDDEHRQQHHGVNEGQPLAPVASCLSAVSRTTNGVMRCSASSPSPASSTARRQVLTG